VVTYAEHADTFVGIAPSISEVPRPTKHGDASLTGAGVMGLDLRKSDRLWLHQKNLNHWSMASSTHRTSTSLALTQRVTSPVSCRRTADVCDSAHIRTFKGLSVMGVTMTAAPLT